MNSANPYRPPVANWRMSPAEDAPIRSSLTWDQATCVLFASYATTVVAGGTFGIVGCFIGIFIGAVLAGSIGFVVFSIAMLVNLVTRASRYVAILATLCGGLTGWLSMRCLGGPADFADHKCVFTFVMAAVFGACGSGCVAWPMAWMWERQNHQRAMAARDALAVARGKRNGEHLA